MRRSPLEILDHRLRDLRKTRRRLDSLYKRRRITGRDLNAVYESLFLQAVVAFEVYCEQMFFAVVTGRFRYSRNILTCRLGALPEKTARVIVLQNEKYLDWLPWERTKDRCKLYFCVKGDAAKQCGRPFFELQGTDKDVIDRIIKIRHAIAHASDAAKARFLADVVKNSSAKPDEETPAGWLRGMYAKNVTRLQNYFDSLLTIALKIFGKPLKRRANRGRP